MLDELKCSCPRCVNKVTFRVVKSDGRILEGESTNLRTETGATWQAAQMANSPSTIVRHISLTTNTDTPASTDTNLVGELSADGLSRQTGTFSHTAGSSRYTLSSTWQYTGASVITVAKAGLSSALTDRNDSNDTLFLVTTLSPVAVLDSDDTLSLAWGISF